MSAPRRRVSSVVASILFLLTCTAAVIIPSSARAAAGDGSPGDPNISFIGRWDTSNSSAYVGNWAGAYLKVGFTGTTVKLKQRNAIDIYTSIDGQPDVMRTNVSGTVDLTPTPLAAGNHTLRVAYRAVVGSYKGDAVFQGLILDSGARTLPATVYPKLVEFVGDSITLGSTSSKVAFTAYPWVTGELAKFEHTDLGYGGGCLVAAADGCNGMINQFLKLGYADTSPNWNFSRYQANAVVINLGTNDKSHSVSSADFQSTYVSFLKEVRAQYPAAAIIAMRTFTGRYAAETQAAVKTVTDAGDKKVTYVDTTGWVTSALLSDSVHPNDAGHQAIAAKLAPIITTALAG